MGVKINALFLYLSKSRQGKYLKTAGIRQNRPVPVHEFMKSAKLLNQLVTGSHVQMVGVGQLYLCSDFLQIVGRYGSLYRPHSSHIHENRCLDSSMDGFHLCPFRASVFVKNLILHILFLFLCLCRPLSGRLLFFFLIEKVPHGAGQAYGRISTADNTHHQRKCKLADGRYSHQEENKYHDKCCQGGIDTSRQRLADT